MTPFVLARRRFLIAVAAIVLAGASAALGADATFQFVQMCDTQFGMGEYDRDVRNFREAVKQINELAPAFVVVCGDLVHNPNANAFADWNAVRKGFKVPCYAAPGNHDIGATATLQSITMFRETIGPDRQTWDHGGVTFIAINTPLWKSVVEKETEAQDEWLRGLLKKARKKGQPVIIAGHHPLFDKSPDEPDSKRNVMLATRKEFVPLFKKSGVIAVLTGHVHRFIALEHDGIQYISGETTCKNFDKRPFGYRVWTVDVEKKTATHEFVALKNQPKPAPAKAKSVKSGKGARKGK